MNSQRKKVNKQNNEVIERVNKWSNGRCKGIIS